MIVIYKLVIQLEGALLYL